MPYDVLLYRYRRLSVYVFLHNAYPNDNSEISVNMIIYSGTLT